MHLTDAFMELVAYVVYFVKTVGAKQPPYEQAKADILRFLTQSENVVKRGLFTQEDYDLGRFMICAWVDEAILNSSVNQKGQWQREQLQRLYYHTLDAGEEAFERLNGLGLHQREVREVYYLCLALGFKGRFHHPGDEYLLGSSVGLPSLERAELFPEAYPVEAVELGVQKQKFRLSPFTIACLAGPVILFGLLFLIYQFALSGVGENFLKAVP